MTIRKNVGRIDRYMRLAAAAGLFVTGLAFLGGMSGRPDGLFIAAVGFIPLATGLAGFCPLYVPLGLSTRAKREGAPPCCGGLNRGD